MDVGAVSSPSDALASAASGLKAGQISMQISVAVAKQIQDTERLQAEALVRMMQQTTAAARGGVDVYA